GQTSKEIIQMAKNVGAKKVIVASCAPPVSSVTHLYQYLSDRTLTVNRYPHVYGIDMPSRSELVAYGCNEEDIAEAIGTNLVIFQTLPDLIESVRHINPSIKRFDCPVFDGDYVTGGRR
ncbi:hypothetical protein GYMLUDRAFT_177004, partial [Collybiopsis luxurians FD-317 M1]